MKIPDKLVERLGKLGIDPNIYETRAGKCILSREPLKLERVPWYEHAYYLPEDFLKERSTKGASSGRGLFVFDPVSLVPCLALDPMKEDGILDMCAAPGTKTFILSFLTDNEARITANDISYNRVKRLHFNVEKFGLSAEISNLSGRKITGEYDKILLDAPCSGEGMVNKNEKIFDHWSEKRIRILAKKQKKLIAHAFGLLKPGGTLVYSTCTFEPEENEGVIEALLEKFPNAGLEEIDVKINHVPGLRTWNGKELDHRVEKCMRIYPQHNGTGGFFACKIRNP
jgi:NOL1/NOP2/sun family putative RNA methylase